jgi:hypothetical protein
VRGKPAFDEDPTAAERDIDAPSRIRSSCLLHRGTPDLPHTAVDDDRAAQPLLAPRAVGEYTLILT